MIKKWLFLGICGVLFCGCESSEEIRAKYKEKFSDNCQYGTDYAEGSDLYCDCAANFYLRELTDREVRLASKGFHANESEETFRLYYKLQDIETWTMKSDRAQEEIKQCMQYQATKRNKK